MTQNACLYHLSGRLLPTTQNRSTNHPDSALAGHFRRYLENNPERTLIEGKSDAELADLLVTASTKADDDFAITRIFDYAMKFIRHEGED